jgi:succinate dehydrogenase/fumarate reductase flavoprotein subunit
MMHTTALNLRSMIDVSRMVVASALAREETRGAHSRGDFPDQRDDYGLFNSHVRRGSNGAPQIEKRPVRFNRKSLEECQNYRKPKG